MVDKELEEIIKNAIPNWEVEIDKFNTLIAGLKANDVSSYTDLTEEILPKEDLLEYASKVWINKIYLAVKTRKNSQKTSSEANATNEQEPRNVGALDNEPRAENLLINVINFELDWNKIGNADILATIPLDNDKKKTIRHLVVGQIICVLGHDPKDHSFWQRIANQMADKNISFCRKINQTYARYALEECMVKLKNHFGYRVQSARLNKSNHVPAKRLKKSVRHGCKEWSANNLPEGKNDNSLEIKRQSLQNIYNEVSRAQWDMQDINTKMTSLLYGPLRDCINDDKDEAREVARKFPFIKIPSVFLNHYSRLTETDAQLQIAKFISEHMKNHIDFFTMFSQKHKETVILKTVLQRDYSATDEQLFLLSIQMIAHYMNEDKFFDQMVHCVEIADQNSEISDAFIESIDNPPSTPAIVSLGDPVWSAKSFCITVDRFVLARVEDITTAFALYFASYFVFNAEYTNNLNSTLDYVERFIMGVATEDASISKMSSKRKHKARVTSLDEEYNSYVELTKRRRTV